MLDYKGLLTCISYICAVLSGVMVIITPVVMMFMYGWEWGFMYFALFFVFHLASACFDKAPSSSNSDDSEYLEDEYEDH